jgi:hypothetical protein
MEDSEERENCRDGPDGRMREADRSHVLPTSHDKSNGVINHRWADAFNDWVSKWSLLELDPQQIFYLD